MSFARLALVFFVCLFLFQSIQAGWTKVDTGTLAWLHSVYFVNENTGWIVGSNGTYLSTQDGGRSWQHNRRVTRRRVTKDNIWDVYFSDAQTGWLLCERNIYSVGKASPSYLMQTSDGGESWEKTEIEDSQERMVRFVAAKHELLLAIGEGGAIWRMQVNKKIWRKITLPVSSLMLGGTFTSDLRGVLIGGGGTLLLTEDGGTNWEPAPVSLQDKNKLNSVFFPSNNTGWTVGVKGKIYSTNNGGKTWRDQVSTVTSNLFDVFFVNDSEGFVVGDNGTILHTTTAGAVWTVEKTPSKHKLERVFFAGGRGFAVGFGGTILKYESNQLGF